MLANLAKVFLLCGVLGSEVLKTSLDIEEDGHHYQQTMEYDPLTMALTISVPAHNSIDASTVIIHKQSVIILFFNFHILSFNI